MHGMKDQNIFVSDRIRKGGMLMRGLCCRMRLPGANTAADPDAGCEYGQYVVVAHVWPRGSVRRSPRWGQTAPWTLCLGLARCACTAGVAGAVAGAAHMGQFAVVHSLFLIQIVSPGGRVWLEKAWRLSVMVGNMMVNPDYLRKICSLRRRAVVRFQIERYLRPKPLSGTLAPPFLHVY